MRLYSFRAGHSAPVRLGLGLAAGGELVQDVLPGALGEARIQGVALGGHRGELLVPLGLRSPEPALIPLKPASMDRVNGWAEVLQRLADGGESVRAKLFIHRRCGRLAETLPRMQHDPNRPEDVLTVDADEDGIGGDDAADALRYLIATKSRTITQRKLRGL